MGWVQRAFEERLKKGVYLKVSVPMGVNPFRDLWDKFFGQKRVGGNHVKNKREQERS